MLEIVHPSQMLVVCASRQGDRRMFRTMQPAKHRLLGLAVIRFLKIKSFNHSIAIASFIFRNSLRTIST